MPYHDVDRWVRGGRGSKAAIMGALLFLCQSAASQEQSQSRLLQPGTTYVEQVEAGGSRHYRINLSAGQAVELSLVQTEGTIRLNWTDDSKRDYPSIQSDAGRFARLSLTLAAAGVWTIEIAPRQTNAGSKFQLELGSIHLETDADRHRVAAGVALAEAEASRAANKHDAADAIVAKYDLAASEWQASTDSCGVQIARIGEARFLLDVARYPDAQRMAEAALEVQCTSDKQSMVLAQRAQALRVLSSAVGYQGDYAAAADFGEKSLLIYRNADDPVSQGWLLGNLSPVYRKLGETSKALRDAQEARTIAQKLGNRNGAVFAQEAMASIHLARGELALALDGYKQTLAELQATPYPMVEGMAWSDLGLLYGLLGDNDQAQEAYGKAEAIWASSGNSYRMASLLWNKGFLLLANKQASEAQRAFQRAYDLSVANHYQSEQSHALEGLGRCAMSVGHWSEANSRFHASLDLARSESGNAAEIDADLALGDLDSGMQKLSSARSWYELALRLAHQSRDSNSEPVALGSLARIAQQSGNLLQAKRLIEAALQIIESQRTQINEARLRTSFFASWRSYYEFYIEILMQLDRKHPGHGYAASALEVSERARARTLQDMLSERTLSIDHGVDADLVEKVSSTEDHLHATAYRLSTISANARADVKTQLQDQVDKASLQLDELRGRIRSSSPRYAELVNPERLTLHEIQSQLLTSRTVLLEYWLGEKKSYLWLVSSRGLRSFELLPRSSLETLADQLRDKLAAGHATVVNVSIDALPALDAANMQSVRALSAELGKKILGPAGNSLVDKNLVVVADGELELIPFDILSSIERSNPSPWVNRHNVVYLPSIQTVRLLRARNSPPSHAPTLAVMADPVFTADDPRLQRQPYQTLAQTSSDVSRAANDVNVGDLPRLRHSRDEAQTIAGLLPQASTWVALDFNASRQMAMQATWRNYSLVHFATHALLDLRHPELSGIVLSLFDAAGRPQDGFLRMNDIYNLEIPAELVMLSACKTAVGARVGEEGAFSLSRAFFYAGARRVLVSLWPVDDQASAQFAAYFYRNLLEKGQSPGEALRIARNEMAADPRWQLPYYWAGYVLQGDWQ